MKRKMCKEVDVFFVMIPGIISSTLESQPSMHTQYTRSSFQLKSFSQSADQKNNNNNKCKLYANGEMAISKGTHFPADTFRASILFSHFNHLVKLDQ